MDADKFQQAWQSQESPNRIMINTELLLKEVQRSQRLFSTILFWRDVREVGVALVLIPVWLILGTSLHLPWTWYLTVPALIWIAGYMLVDRMRHKRQPVEQGKPLRRCVDASLAQVEQQIRLLRSVLWWGLLPLFLSMLAFVGQIAWHARSALVALATGGIIVTVMVWVYWLNQRAIRASLEPRRQELLALQRGLGEKTNAGDS